MNPKQWLILKLGGQVNYFSCPVCGFRNKENDINDSTLSPFSLGKHLSLKLRQVGDDKIGVVSTSYPLSDEQILHVRRGLSDKLIGYKFILLESLDMELGILAKDKLKDIHNKIHKFLEV